MGARAFLRVAFVVAVVYPALPQAQTPPACVVSGTITSNRIPLPGVVVSIVGADHQALDVSSTGVDGSYALKIPAAADGVSTVSLKTELVAFAPVSRDLTINADSCSQRIDIAMTLAARAQANASDGASAPNATPSAPLSARANAPRAATRGAGRGSPSTPQQPFQSLELRADLAGLARGDDAGAVDGGEAVVLPPGFSPQSSTESVTAVGTSPQNDLFFGPNGPGDFAQRFGAFGQGGFDGSGAAAAAFGGPQDAGGRAGPGGRGGPGGGFGPAFGGPLGRGGRGNQIRAMAYQSFDASALDAAPYGLNGQPTVKPDYFQQRFGATIGGPLTIPKIIDNPRTFFFLNYTGNRARNPYDAYSTVPTAAERAGDLSVFSKPVVDPATGQPFADNRIPAAALDPAAQRLLAFVPLPNQAGVTQNFHNVTTVTNELDDVNLRFVHTFGAVPQRGRGRGQGGGRGGGGRGGGGGRAGVSSLNVAVHYRRADTTSANPFPSLGGSSTTSAWDVPVNYSFTKKGLFNALRFDVNRQRSQSQNLYAFSTNVAGEAGLLGTASDPFDWGVPGISLSSFTSLRDSNPVMRTDRTLSIGDTTTKTHKNHTVRFGGDLRSLHLDSRTDVNARGSYVFTGLYSGVDFADFLLGFPQQASVQYGPGLEQFRSTSWDLFAQDDWRVTDKLTINAGLRYEYFSPVSEAGNRLITLDVSPSFTAAVPVDAGGTGPFSGPFADTIVNPFRSGLEPRVGVAWRPKQGVVLRGGYSVNYNSSVYQGIAQQLAGQPPFAVTNTVLATAAAPVPLESALLVAAPGTIANTYAVDPNFRLPSVQIWNVDLQRDLSRTVQIGIGYTGTKGSDLDLLRAPNRGPDGLRIPDVAPFIFESSSADSVMHSITARIRKRLTAGFAVGGSYTLSKSTDDASSIAGGGGTVAQNDQDLQAEWGLSTFDQRHRFTGDFTWELPFGSNRRWLTTGGAAQLFGNWVLNANVQAASGLPFTARVLGAVTDVARGTNGTLRANYNGAPIAVADPTTLLFFNTSAFSIPAPGTFGSAGRDTIIGPGTSVMNLGITKNIALGQTRGLSIQVMAANVFNTVQYAAIDTVANSPTFGQVTAARPMRRLQILTRVRF